VPDPDLWGGGRGGGGEAGRQTFFFGLKIRGVSGPPGSLPWIRH